MIPVILDTCSICRIDLFKRFLLKVQEKKGANILIPFTVLHEIEKFASSNHGKLQKNSQAALDLIIKAQNDDLNLLGFIGEDVRDHADMHIIKYLASAATDGIDEIIIVSNDADLLSDITEIRKNFTFLKHKKFHLLTIEETVFSSLF